MLNLEIPDGTSVLIGGNWYKLSVHSFKYSFNRADDRDNLLEAFDIFRDTNGFVLKSYQITHYYRNIVGKLLNDVQGFTLAEIRENGLQHLLENWKC